MSKLSDLVEQVEPGKRLLAENLATEIRFMKTELARQRKRLREAGSTEHFVNGKQEMERVTPALQAYTALLGRYATYHKQFAALLPKDATDQGDELDEFLKELRG